MEEETISGVEMVAGLLRTRGIDYDFEGDENPANDTISLWHDRLGEVGIWINEGELTIGVGYQRNPDKIDSWDVMTTYPTPETLVSALFGNRGLPT